MVMMVKMFKPCFPFSCPVSAPLVTAFSGRLGVQFRRKRGKGANQGDRATKQSTTWALLQLQRVLPWNNRWSSTSFFFLLPWNNQCWSACHCCAAMNNHRSPISWSWDNNDQQRVLLVLHCSDTGTNLWATLLSLKYARVWENLSFFLRIQLINRFMLSLNINLWMFSWCSASMYTLVTSSAD